MTRTTMQERPAAAYVAEFFGTFSLVFVVCTVFSLGPEFTIIGLVHVMVLTLLVYALGATSGAHLNPAITISLAALRKISLLDAVAYLCVQFAGGIVGALLCRGLFADEGEAVGFGALGLSEPLIQGDVLIGVIVEGIGAFFLMFAFMAAAVNPRARPEWAGLIIGLTYGMLIFIFGPVTGGGFNPARWLGPAIVAGEFGDAWVFLAGPIVGALVGGFAYTALVLRPRRRVGEPPIEHLDPPPR